MYGCICSAPDPGFRHHTLLSSTRPFAFFSPSPARPQSQKSYVHIRYAVRSRRNCQMKKPPQHTTSRVLSKSPNSRRARQCFKSGLLRRCCVCRCSCSSHHRPSQRPGSKPLSPTAGTRRDKTRRDETRRNEARQNKTRKDNTKPDSTTKKRHR